MEIASEKERPLVSVLVPVYNREKWIDRCLNSIINQTYKNLEILVYDDGSTDKSIEILKNLAEKDNRIQLLLGDQNSGVSSARSKLIQAAKGKYTFFCDSDDTMILSEVEKMVNIFETFDVDLVYCRFILEKKGYSIKQLQTYIPDGLYRKEELKKYYFKNPINLFWSSLCNKCFKTELIKNKELVFEEKMEDVLFNIDYLKYISKVYVISDYLYVYNQTNGSLTREGKHNLNNTIQLKEEWDCLKKVYDKILSSFANISDEDIIKLDGYFYKKYLNIKQKSINQEEINEYLENDSIINKIQITLHNKTKYYSFIYKKECFVQKIKNTINYLLRIIMNSKKNILKRGNDE